MTPNISPFLLGSVFVSAAFLIRPGMALVMDVLAYLLFYIGIGFTQPDPVQLLTKRQRRSMVTWRSLTPSDFQRLRRE